MRQRPTGFRGTGPRWPLVLVVTGLALMLGAAVRSPALALCGPIVAVVLVAEWRRRRRVELERRSGEGLVAVADQLIQQLRGGASLRQSCESLTGAPASRHVTAMAELAGRLNHGEALATAARRLRQHPDRSVRLVGITIETLAGNGGPAVPALQRLRMTLVAAAQARGQAEAEAAQPMASAALLAAAPAVFAAVVASLDPAVGRLYLHEVLGAACLAVSLLLSASGWWWMQATVARLLRCGL